MSGNWWKFGLAALGGAGVGYAVGVKLTRDKAQKERDADIESIRELYRESRKKALRKDEPKKKQKQEIENKTSLQVTKLSEKKDEARDAAKVYHKSLDGLEDQKKEVPLEKDYLHIVDDVPDNTDFTTQQLTYFAGDSTLAYTISGGRVPEDDIDSMVGVENIQKFELDDVYDMYIQNDLRRTYYVIQYDPRKYLDIVKEEPYKGEL